MGSTRPMSFSTKNRMDARLAHGRYPCQQTMLETTVEWCVITLSTGHVGDYSITAQCVVALSAGHVGDYSRAVCGNPVYRQCWRLQ